MQPEQGHIGQSNVNVLTPFFFLKTKANTKEEELQEGRLEGERVPELWVCALSIDLQG